MNTLKLAVPVAQEIDRYLSGQNVQRIQLVWHSTNYARKSAIYYNCRFKIRIILTAAELESEE